ncbi:hypothetical protein HMPREF0484_1041 [Klebsiella pneumoniae subsp. rhinoscleromatis ATCC 13884]|nr:hypothetical protein HMPREF0484_1041 [Klebsiella pneumoniae subsp. rhinoscleromatis ATCC 13884]
MHGRDIASSLHSAVKTDTQKEQRRRTWNRITRALPGRQRAGYEQQADAMYETGLVLMYVMNLATGYAYTSLTELAATPSKTGWHERYLCTGWEKSRTENRKIRAIAPAG